MHLFTSSGAGLLPKSPGSFTTEPLRLELVNKAPNILIHPCLLSIFMDYKLLLQGNILALCIARDRHTLGEGKGFNLPTAHPGTKLRVHKTKQGFHGVSQGLQYFVGTAITILHHHRSDQQIQAYVMRRNSFDEREDDVDLPGNHRRP